jgi:hypothetical protein
LGPKTASVVGGLLAASAQSEARVVRRHHRDPGLTLQAMRNYRAVVSFCIGGQGMLKPQDPSGSGARASAESPRRGCYRAGCDARPAHMRLRSRFFLSVQNLRVPCTRRPARKTAGEQNRCLSFFAIFRGHMRFPLLDSAITLHVHASIGRFGCRHGTSLSASQGGGRRGASYSTDLKFPSP